MSSRVCNKKENIVTRNYLSTRRNPANLCRRGCELSEFCEFWWVESEWLQDFKNWPAHTNIINHGESEIERKRSRNY